MTGKAERNLIPESYTAIPRDTLPGANPVKDFVKAIVWRGITAFHNQLFSFFVKHRVFA